jgi:hypothetical protein
MRSVQGVNGRSYTRVRFSCWSDCCLGGVALYSCACLCACFRVCFHTLLATAASNARRPHRRHRRRHRCRCFEGHPPAMVASQPQLCGLEYVRRCVDALVRRCAGRPSPKQPKFGQAQSSAGPTGCHFCNETPASSTCLLPSTISVQRPASSVQRPASSVQRPASSVQRPACCL